MTSEANLSHSPLFLSREHGKGQFYKFRRFIKIIKNNYKDKFCRSGDQQIKEIYNRVAKKIWGVRCSLRVCEEDLNKGLHHKD